MDDVRKVFSALADESRRALLDALNARNGQTLRELCAGLTMTRQSVSKHLAVLEAAGLVTTVWRGREKLHHLNAEPINAIADRWIGRYHRERARALADLKSALESPPMADDTFVYVTYIRTTPEQLWRALTDPAFTKRYWGVELHSDWRKGSAVAWHLDEVVIDDPEQVILESDPYKRLSYRWHTFTPQFAAKYGFGDELLARMAAERRSRATFELEPHGDQVKLTLIHDDFDPDSVVLATVDKGWPSLLSSLKTLLETGEPLPKG